MTFTYDPTLATDRDRIRFTVGDTDAARPANQRLEDEEIEATVSSGGLARATVSCAEALLSKLLRLPTEKRVGGLEFAWKERIAALKSRIVELKADLGGAAIPYAGGISKSDRATVQADSDLVESPFRMGMFDNPRAS